MIRTLGATSRPARPAHERVTGSEGVFAALLVMVIMPSLVSPDGIQPSVTVNGFFGGISKLLGETVNAGLVGIEIVPTRSPVLPVFLMMSFAGEFAPTPIPTGLNLTVEAATISAPLEVAVAVGVGVAV